MSHLYTPIMAQHGKWDLVCCYCKIILTKPWNRSEDWLLGHCPPYVMSVSTSVRLLKEKLFKGKCLRGSLTATCKEGGSTKAAASHLRSKVSPQLSGFSSLKIMSPQTIYEQNLPQWHCWLPHLALLEVVGLWPWACGAGRWEARGMSTSHHY